MPCRMQGIPKDSAKTPNLPRNPHASTDPRVGLHDVVRFIRQIAEELVNAVAEFTTGDRDVHFRGKTSRTLQVVSVERFFQPTRAFTLQSARHLKSSFGSPRPNRDELRFDRTSMRNPRPPPS